MIGLGNLPPEHQPREIKKNRGLPQIVGVKSRKPKASEFFTDITHGFALHRKTTPKPRNPQPD